MCMSVANNYTNTLRLLSSGVYSLVPVLFAPQCSAISFNLSLHFLHLFNSVPFN